MSMNVCPDDTFWMDEPFTTKLGMVMPDCLPKRLLCCLQGQGQDHSEGSYNQNVTFWYISWTADPFATKFGLMAHRHKLDRLVKRLNCSVVVKVKVTRKVQNSSGCLSGWYLWNFWNFRNQIWYGDVSSWTREEDWFAVFRVTVRSHKIKYDCFYHIYWTCWSFCNQI